MGRRRVHVAVAALLAAAVVALGLTARADWSAGAESARRTSIGTTPRPTSPPTPSAAKTAVAAAAPAPTSTTAARTAVNAALSYAQSRGEQAVVAVYDRTSKQTFSAGDTTAQYQSASVVKTLIVANLFWTGQMSDPAIAARAYEMITKSDDDAANYLYGLAGYDDLTSIVSTRLGLSGLAPPVESGSWGSTYITAAAMMSFYQRVFADLVIGPWLTNAMAHTTETAADGTDQFFGIPSATSSWAVKQGWVCCTQSVAAVNSTGLVDNDRFIVVMLTQGPPSLYLNYLSDTVTAMAQILLPNGHFPV